MRLSEPYVHKIQQPFSECKMLSCRTGREQEEEQPVTTEQSDQVAAFRHTCNTDILVLKVLVFHTLRQYCC